MSRIIWTDDFILGIDAFDRQHQHLVALLNEAGDCLEQGSDRARASELLTGLSLYARDHFAAEEAFMAEKRYPGIEAHCQLHSGFTRTIATLQSRLNSGDEAVVAELARYLDHWLIDHIVINDAQYAVFAGTLGKPGLMV